MEPEQNLHAKISPALLAETVSAAQDDHITVDQFVQDAVERRLRDRRRSKLYAYGEAQARVYGIEEHDVEQIIHDFRQEDHSSQSEEPGR